MSSSSTVRPSLVCVRPDYTIILAIIPSGSSGRAGRCPVKGAGTRQLVGILLWFAHACLVSNVVRRHSNVRPLHVLTSGRSLLIKMENLSLLLVEVLAWVGGLVFQKLDEAVKADSDERAEGWAEPIDPVVAWEVVEYNAGAEGASRVQGACS